MASELEVGKLGAGVAPAAPLHAKTPATTGTSPLEVARLEVKDEGVNMAVGMGPKLSFYTPHNDASFEGASIAAKKENQSDTNESTSLTFSTCPDGGTNTERLTIASDGNIEQHTDSNGIVKFGVKNESTGTSARAMVNVLSDSGNLDLSMNGSNYTGVAGWADSGTISTGSGASGGLKMNAVVGGLALQTNQTTRLSIANSTGLATFNAGVVTSEKGVLSGSVTVADDAVTTITPQRKGGFLKISADTTSGDGNFPQVVFCGEVYFDCGVSLDIRKHENYASGFSTQLDVSTSDVSGSTGTDGNVTVAVQAGVIKIENRRGGVTTFNYTITC
jgi:hypothetical protein